MALTERKKLVICLAIAMVARATCPWPLGVLRGPAIVSVLLHKKE